MLMSLSSPCAPSLALFLTIASIRVSAPGVKLCSSASLVVSRSVFLTTAGLRDTYRASLAYHRMMKGTRRASLCSGSECGHAVTGANGAMSTTGSHTFSPNSAATAVAYMPPTDWPMIENCPEIPRCNISSRNSGRKSATLRLEVSTGVDMPRPGRSGVITRRRWRRAESCQKSGVWRVPPKPIMKTRGCPERSPTSEKQSCRPSVKYIFWLRSGSWMAMSASPGVISRAPRRSSTTGGGGHPRPRQMYQEENPSTR
mmetsp:Transcript_62644/g.198359  ORF Transcript_62644/g.198359 Transcript_62644/m.198359 type:complete len:257 (-) Transcript_62644:178-948(-)